MHTCTRVCEHSLGWCIRASSGLPAVRTKDQVSDGIGLLALAPVDPSSKFNLQQVWALMGCRPCPWAITLSQPTIYGTRKVFSLNKRGWGGRAVSPVQSGLQLRQICSLGPIAPIQGKPQAQENFPSAPLPLPRRFRGTRKDENGDGKIKHYLFATSDWPVAKRKLIELGFLGPWGSCCFLLPN